MYGKGQGKHGGYHGQYDGYGKSGGPGFKGGASWRSDYSAGYARSWPKGGGGGKLSESISQMSELMWARETKEYKREERLAKQEREKEEREAKAAEAAERKRELESFQDSVREPREVLQENGRLGAELEQQEERAES